MKELNVENETVRESSEHMHKSFHNVVAGRAFISTPSQSDVIKENTDGVESKNNENLL